MNVLSQLVDLLWGPWTFFIILMMGLIATIATRFVQTTSLTHGLEVLRGDYDDHDDPGAISHFQALSAALSATVGLGNIGGVALAIAIGGPGALFWMWIVALLGMALKSVEITLALQYRTISEEGEPRGGSMWVIREALKNKGPAAKTLATVLATVFASTTIISTMTGGNIFQVWNVTEITAGYFGVPGWLSAAVLATLVALVVLGGIQRIGQVAALLVPFMCAVYIVCALAVLALHIEQVPETFALIIHSAFSPTEAAGAFVGSSVYYAFSMGMRRAIFSNEAGQGTAPMAHAAARTDEPAREGIVGGIGPFIDTIIICTLTAMVILITGTWNRAGIGAFDAELSIVAQDEDGRHWEVVGDWDLSAMPARERGQWEAGTPFYLIAHTDGLRDAQAGGGSRIEVSGEILPDPNDSGALTARFAPLNLRPSEWQRMPGEIVVADGAVYERYNGAEFTALGFDRAFPGFGRWLVTIASWLFAISTMISYSYYYEQGVAYFFGGKALLALRGFYVAVAAATPWVVSDVDRLIRIIDVGTGSMLWSNIPILLITGWLGIMTINNYRRRLRSGLMQPNDSQGEAQG